jgi:hypothetical protein
MADPITPRATSPVFQWSVVGFVPIKEADLPPITPPAMAPAWDGFCDSECVDEKPADADTLGDVLEDEVVDGVTVTVVGSGLTDVTVIGSGIAVVVVGSGIAVVVVGSRIAVVVVGPGLVAVVVVITGGGGEAEAILVRVNTPEDPRSWIGAYLLLELQRDRRCHLHLLFEGNKK